jgi:hypothetical protein
VKAVREKKGVEAAIKRARRLAGRIGAQGIGVR